MQKSFGQVVLIGLSGLIGAWAVGCATGEKGSDWWDWTGGDGTGGGGSAPTGPSEVCGNGLDDTGNNQIDEGCACDPGAVQACFAGNPLIAGQGVCTYGEQTCVKIAEGNGEFPRIQWGKCQGSGEIAGEVCDQLDNDCDGAVDEDCPCTEGEKVACSTICGSGEQHCSNGKWTLCSTLGAALELCNGGDDDCDGQTDETCACVPQSSTSCYSGPASTASVGTCHGGSMTCTADGSGHSACTGEVIPKSEECANGLDDDCDGSIDEDCSCTPGAVVNCYSGSVETRGVGECHDGSMTCLAGGAGYSACMGQVSPQSEVCGNAVDEDCDGKLDNGCDVVNLAACNPPQSVIVALEAAGLQVSMEPISAASLSKTRVICSIGAAELGVSLAEIRDWVAAGGGFFSMSIGDGASDECSADATLHPLFGFGYDCSVAPNPWGPVTQLESHPVTMGLQTSNVPFRNGTAITESVAGSSIAVAWVGMDVVARAGTHGAGRVFVLGDEHLTIAQHLPDQVPLFVNIVRWLHGSL